MSYILDALRRADAERERGSIPDLRAQPVPPRPADERPRGSAGWMPWAVGGLGLAVLVLLAWQWIGREEPRPAPVATSATPTPRTPPAAANASQAQAAPAIAAAKPAVTVVATAPPRSVKPAAAASAPDAAASGARIYAQRELPEEVRRQLPALAIGGSMYSENPTNRMLIVNGQLFHEHEKPAPGVSLEQIRLKSAVLEYKGYRFELSY